MGYYVARLNRPYDFRVLIEAYIYTKRRDFVHADFKAYYAGLLQALEGLFGIRLSGEALSSLPSNTERVVIRGSERLPHALPANLAVDQQVLWQLFENTVSSLLRITSPWDGYLESSLTHRMLEKSGEHGKAVHRASLVIHEANEASTAAHRDILCALFVAIFGPCRRVVTSEELAQAKFDDSKEPDVSNYYDYF